MSNPFLEEKITQTDAKLARIATFTAVSFMAMCALPVAGYVLGMELGVLALITLIPAAAVGYGSRQYNNLGLFLDRLLCKRDALHDVQDLPDVVKKNAERLILRDVPGYNITKVSGFLPPAPEKGGKVYND